jgi:hypothetical protein
MAVAKSKINSNKKYMSNAGNFEGHANMVVQCRVHRLMDRIRGFMRSH